MKSSCLDYRLDVYTKNERSPHAANKTFNNLIIFYRLLNNTNLILLSNGLEINFVKYLCLLLTFRKNKHCGTLQIESLQVLEWWLTRARNCRQILQFWILQAFKCWKTLPIFWHGSEVHSLSTQEKWWKSCCEPRSISSFLSLDNVDIQKLWVKYFKRLSYCEDENILSWNEKRAFHLNEWNYAFMFTAMTKFKFIPMKKLLKW